MRGCSRSTRTPPGGSCRCASRPISTASSSGGQKSADIENPLFHLAPQRALYPDAKARPSPESVAAFLKANGIDYIYADAMHPNTLVPEAHPDRDERGRSDHPDP